MRIRYVARGNRYDWYRHGGDENTQSMSVHQLKARMGRLQLTPQLPDSKVALSDVGVVEQDDTLVAQLREPCLEVVLYRLICVEGINVEEIDALLGKMFDGLVTC